mgnify:CR=1 FL=1
MKLSRRYFLGGTIAVVAAAVVGPHLHRIPTIWAGGIHDDADGLQALMSGKPFVVAGEGMTARSGTLRGGSYLVGHTLAPDGRVDIVVHNATFTALPSLRGPMFQIENVRSFDFRGNILKGAGIAFVDVGAPHQVVYFS